MQIRLGPCLVAATLLLAAGPTLAQDQAMAPARAKATGVSATVDDCVRYVAQQAMVVRCAAVEPQMMSDHAAPYDAQGNLVDRQGNVVAAPSGRTQYREVFASERSLR